MATNSFILSDQTVNSYGFVMLTSGGDLTEFKKNPVMLYNHCPEDVPGRWNNVRVEGEKLLADPEFDEADPEAKDLKGKVDRGFIKGCSIGFQITEMSLSVQGFEDIPVATKWILYEASITPLPSNANALRVYDVSGQLMNDTQIQNFIQLNRNQKLNINNQPMQKLAILIATLQLTADSTEDQVIAAVNKLAKRASDADAELTALTTEKANLTAEITTLKAQIGTQQDAKCETLIDGAIAAGKVTKAERETWMKLAKVDFESTKLALDSKAAHVPVGDQLNQNNNVASGDEKFLSMSFLQIKKTEGGAEYLTRLMASNKALYEKKRTNPNTVIAA